MMYHIDHASRYTVYAKPLLVHIFYMLSCEIMITRTYHDVAKSIEYIMTNIVILEIKIYHKNV